MTFYLSKVHIKVYDMHVLYHDTAKLPLCGVPFMPSTVSLGVSCLCEAPRSKTGLSRNMTAVTVGDQSGRLASRG